MVIIALGWSFVVSFLNYFLDYMSCKEFDG
jgi:hypothetical protein